MLWFMGLQNTIYCDTLRVTCYQLYEPAGFCERLAKNEWDRLSNIDSFAASSSARSLLRITRRLERTIE